MISPSPTRETMSEAQGTGIDGVLTLPLRIIPTDGGPVLHLLRGATPLMPRFPDGLGEIYFSEVLPGHVKAWKRHFRQNQLFAVPRGLLRLALYDDREASPTRGALQVLTLGRPDNYNLLRIPAGIWHGFAALGGEAALLCNCADMPHDPAESERRPVDTPEIPYSWDNFR